MSLQHRNAPLGEQQKLFPSSPLSHSLLMSSPPTALNSSSLGPPRQLFHPPQWAMGLGVPAADFGCLNDLRPTVFFPPSFLHLPRASLPPPHPPCLLAGPLCPSQRGATKTNYLIDLHPSIHIHSAHRGR
jgi:hypothetical protein